MKERKKKDIANEFGVLPSTLSNILKNKEVILKNAEDLAVNTKRKRLRPCHFEDIEETMLKWLLVARGKNLPLSGPLLKQKAKDFAEALGHHEFEASTGWLDKFKSRHGVIHENYNINYIFNADETALFFKCLPTKTLAFKNEKCFGGKQSKERITVLVGSNMTGSEKLKLLVIGKAKNPRCFKGIKSLGVDYEFNKKAWMTSEIFTKWIVKLDKKFCDQNRKVLFFVDNCTAHPKDVRDKLRNIHLAYFPPNMTSLLQPMDQGIIYNMKQHYRKRILTNILTQVDEGNSVMAIDLLQAVRNLSNVWNVYVKPEIIANCFKKAGFSKDSMQIPFEHWDEEDLLSISDLAALQSSFKKVANIEASFDDYVNVDNGGEAGARKNRLMFTITVALILNLDLIQAH
ncbi:tigger transposable element-derived protein 4-like [Anastrepha ludens]|uniref:tigger transposable element-derived protein 4-like n=1 Tax=Anastrepha ludens TaxID=28586 RepID=UPI0023B03395|nr:tigger transposable element-derived protein 4-like [Anastrepha ludens]